MSGRIMFTKDGFETIVDITGTHYSVMELLNSFWERRFNQKVVVQWGVVNLTDCVKYFAFDLETAINLHNTRVGVRKTKIKHEYGAGYVFCTYSDLDLINILSGPDCRDLMLEVLAEAENKNVHNC